MNSPHWQITEDLETAIADWVSDSWPETSVRAGFQVEAFSQLVNADSPPLIALIPTAVIDDADGQASGDDQDLITVSVVVLSHVPEVATKKIVAVDAIVSRLRRFLKGYEPAEVEVADGLMELPERRSVNYLAVFDHESLPAEIFASCISCEYSLSTGDLNVA